MIDHRLVAIRVDGKVYHPTEVELVYLDDSPVTGRLWRRDLAIEVRRIWRQRLRHTPRRRGRGRWPA